MLRQERWQGARSGISWPATECVDGDFSVIRCDGDVDSASEGGRRRRRCLAAVMFEGWRAAEVKRLLAGWLAGLA